MAVIISLLLNEMVSTKMKKLSQTIIYLPHFMSWVVTAGVFGMLFAPTSAGLVNQVLIKMGLIDKEIYFLGDNDWWRFSYYIINIWHDTGWGTIIFMATLTGIDPGIYEAASIDGAGRWKKMRYILIWLRSLQIGRFGGGAAKVTNGTRSFPLVQAEVGVLIAAVNFC